MGNQQGTPNDLEQFKKYSGFTIKHVMMLRERLEMLSEADLSITKDAFSLAMKTKEEETDRVFRIFDLSSAGKIETLEFVCALSLLAHANLKEKCELMFGLYDFDRNRTMNKQELVILIKTVLTTLNAIASKGECSIQEAQNIADGILKRYDTNEDASISSKEFYSFVSKDPDIVRMLLSYGLISLQDLRFNFGEPPQNDLPVPEVDSDLENEIYKSRIVKTNEDEQIALGIDVQSDGGPVENLNWYKQLVKDNMLLDPDDQEDVASNPPNATLEIDHVYGFRCFDTRNNVRYTPDNEIIYHSGSLILKHGQRQQFFMEHTDDVTCLDIWEHLVASGQMGSKPSILVWDSKTMDLRAVFRGVLTVGVSNLCISNDGRKLAAVGMDEDQCVVVYDIEKGAQIRITGKRDDSLLANGKGPVVEIFDIKFDKNDKQLVIACMGEVNFVTFDNNVLRVVKGIWDQKYCPYQAVLSIGLLDSAVIVGTFRGQLLQWRGSRVTMSVNDAHNGPVTCMYTCKTQIGIITASKDEKIITWDATLKKIQIIDFRIEKIRNVKITSVCQSADREMVLVGTRIGQIVQVKNFRLKVLAYSHYDGKLEALVCHPIKNVFFTAGEDQLVMMWDIDSRSLLCWQRFDFCIKCLEVNEKFLVGGCSNGTILILEQQQLQIHKDFKDRDSEVTCVRLLEEYLVVFYSQPYYEFFVYNVRQNFKKMITVSGRPGNCISIDASISRQFLVTLDTQEMFCMDLMQKKLSKYKEDEWLSFTSTYGWQVKGIWPQHTDGSEIVTIDRDIEKKVVAVGDKFGSIKLYRYPAYKKNASYYRYSGHCSKISKVRFSANSQYLISIGEQEKNIIQWKFCVEDNVIQQSSILHSRNRSQAQNLQETQNNEQQAQTTNKPFLDVIKMDESDDIIPTIPKQYLNLCYVFGAQTSFDGYPLFGQMKYAGQQKIVFPVGCLGVVQDTKIEQSAPYRKQNYYYGHTQQIISLCVHPKGQIIATGSCGDEINLWDVDTRQTLIQIRGFHKEGIRILRFNPDGTLLLGCGSDQYNSICVYDWQANRIICNSKVDKSRIIDCCFISNVEFVTVSKFIRKWQIRGRNLSFDQYSHEVTAIQFAFNSEIVTGNEKGEIQQLKNKQMNSTQAHQGRVNQLVSQKQNLYSAGDDGRIILWHFNQNQLSQKEQFCQQSLPPILSIDVKNDYIVLLTNTCEVRELVITHTNVRSTDIIKGHGEDIDDLAIQKNKIYTCSRDKTIKVWDIRNRCCYINSELFQYQLKSIDIFNNIICVGDSKGFLYLLDEKLNILSQITTQFNVKQKTINYEISKIKFSPDGLRICVGAINGPSHIEILNVYKAQFEKERNIIINCGFTGGILNMDWSEDSQHILAATSNYELKCISITKQRDVQYNYDIKWQTQTCQYGPGLQFIYPQQIGEDITSVYLNKQILYVGDKYGILSIFNYPTTAYCCRQYIGHSSNINSINISQDTQNQYVISVGNQSIMIWQQDIDIPTQLDIEIYKQLGIQQEKQKKTGIEKYGIITNIQQEQQQQQQNNEEDFTNRIITKPWVSNIKEPTTYYKDPLNQSTPPLIDLEIEHAFGYRGNDCKNNIKFLKSGNIVYHTASLGIVLDIQNNQQKIFNLHNDDIISLDLHSDGIRVATGEINTGLIYVWDSNTLQPLCKFQQLNKGIKSLNFSYSTYLVALGMDQFSTIAIFDINTKSIDGGSLVLLHQSGKQIINEIKWLNEQIFYTIGPLHFKEWIIKSQIQIQQIQLPDKNIIFNTFLINDEEMYISDIKGKLFIYLKKQLQLTLEHHTQQIDAITYTRDYLITGGKDQLIIIYDIRQLKEEYILQFKLLDLSKQVFQPQIKSLCYQDQKLIVGTFGCEIWELSMKETKILQTTKFAAKILMKGHYAPSIQSELWGLAVEGDFVYTCGDDATLRQWSVSQKKQIQFIKTVLDSNFVEIKQDDNGSYPDSVRGRSIAANTDFIVVGFRDGGVRIYDKDMKQKSYLKIAKDWISDIKFSPNNDYITFGSHDNCIYIYSFPEMILHLKPLRKHSYYIKNIDYSIDGTKLISTCGGFDLIYWDAILGKQLPQGRNTLRDEKWNTWTNILGWPVQGIWNENFTGQEINCVCRSHQPFASKSPDNYYLLAIGNDFNQILLYRYPCINRKSEPIIRKGHSSPVSSVKFTSDDQFLITMGGEDMTIIFWRVIKKL